MTGSGSSSSSSVTPLPGHGFRTQLGQLLPKHALFQVHLHIDQLSNVPLVSGEFGVRWKFKNVHTGPGLFTRMKNRSVSSQSFVGGKKDKGKGRMEPQMEVISHPEHDGVRSSSDGDLDHRDSLGDSFTMHSNGSAVYGKFLTASPPQTPVPLNATPIVTKIDPPPPSTIQAEARGITEWVPLRSYNAKWDHSVNAVVQMDVHRETADLLPCELKLVALQRVVAGDPNAPQRPRLGAVYLNLAEYANAGPVTRRYLLRDSKTNATLKLTIEVEYVGGEKNYRPPPLRKGEIMASVSGLLSNSDVYRTQLARELDLYTRVDDEDWSDGFQRHHPQPYSNAEGQVDFDRLASSNGLRTTENLIDALFNPVPTANEKSSPFTYYDPEKAGEVEKQAWATERQSTHSSAESGFTEESGGKTPSVYTAGSDNSSGLGQDMHKHWWQKIRGRPGTPLGRQFRPFASTPQLNEIPATPA
ncbi:hypothetical protein PHLCEN_2v8927 [Hermanssonia centrifuga]|uniref:C2 NT-type domain-containing protein n=2 Tax=Hermanssonia centrifuga TaxID=98765 RepID=A0A2R6NS25_9APHY|nr:hypothetical protein PHLCEN_2v8927 [Hermanssonia centrifuga]